MSVEISGFVSAGFEAISAAFTETFRGNPTMGAALAIRVDGEPVVDLWGGVADERTGASWQHDTASVIFSCTKGLISILAARLVQEGRLDYEAPVSTLWPEFAQAGKEGTTVRHFLSHQAGLSAPREDLTVEDILDWDRVTSALARQEPLWIPGEGYAYHAITHGWLVGNVIRAVTGTTVGEYFRHVIGAPLNESAWIGLPATEAARVAHQQIGATLAAIMEQEAAQRDLEIIDWPDRAMTLGGALPRALVTDDGGFNDPSIMAAEIPGAGGIATARALASIWSSVVTPTDGVRLLSDETFELATKVQTQGPPVFAADPPSIVGGWVFNSTRALVAT